jgi:hypothetical protein
VLELRKVFLFSTKSRYAVSQGIIMGTPIQEELKKRIQEVQREIDEIDETQTTKQFEELKDEAGCKNCQEKLDSIPLDERKVTGVLTRKGDVGELVYFSNGASTQEVAKFGTSVLQATMEALKNDKVDKMIFSLELAMFMKNELDC